MALHWLANEMRGPSSAPIHHHSSIAQRSTPQRLCDHAPAGVCVVVSHKVSQPFRRMACGSAGLMPGPVSHAVAPAPTAPCVQVERLAAACEDDHLVIVALTSLSYQHACHVRLPRPVMATCSRSLATAF